MNYQYEYYMYNLKNNNRSTHENFDKIICQSSAQNWNFTSLLHLQKHLFNKFMYCLQNIKKELIK